jgi:hypothetical protein
MAASRKRIYGTSSVFVRGGSFYRARQAEVARPGQLRDASVNWASSEEALKVLIRGLPFQRSEPPADDISF